MAGFEPGGSSTPFALEVEPPVSNFGHVLRDTVWVTYEEHRGQGPLGPITEWVEPFPIRCRLEHKQELIRNDAGAQIASKARLLTDRPVEMTWRFILSPDPPGPDWFQNIEAPEAIGSAPSLDGRTRLWVVWF